MQVQHQILLHLLPYIIIKDILVLVLMVLLLYRQIILLVNMVLLSLNLELGLLQKLMELRVQVKK